MATKRKFVLPKAGTLTPQQKLIAVNQAVGNTHIAKMQGTTRIIFHFLPLNGAQQFNFFKQLNKYAFPYTNLDQNKLTSGESMVLQRAYLAVMIVDPVTGGVTDIKGVSAAGFEAINAGLLQFTTANQVILKDFFTGSMKSVFNKSSKFLNQESYHFDTLQTLLENIEFYATLQVTPYTAVANAYLGYVVEGVGSIVNLKVNQ